MTGFTLNWFLEGSNGSQLTEKLAARQEDWKQEVQTPNYEQPLLAEMVQLASQLRLKNMTKEEILEEVILAKVQNIKILEEVGVCSLEQIKPENQSYVFSKLVSNTYKTEAPLSEEDIKTGYELFHVIVYCPLMVIKYFRFVDQMLSSESPRIIIQSIVNLFQSGAITDKKSFTLARQFYHILASTLELQYGNVLLATMSNEHLQAVIRNDWPFFGNNTSLVEECLQGSSCDGIQDSFQKLGNVFIIC